MKGPNQEATVVTTGGCDLIGIRVAEETGGEARSPASDGLDHGSALDRMAGWATEFKES